MVPATPARSLNLGMVTPFAKNAGIATWPPTTRKPGDYPATANILGAPVIGTDRSTGVIDRYNHAFGYEDLLVCDGAMPTNPGVNVSLAITQ
jgi:choline dehydrogenase-like flavoprotein